ncbi:FadR/GntR family transcriptional regulator [Celeribacter litoreus]|uniref:FadR/GntR family transcriptional regulator n=1 Tax=Celeribacter litoreus TaxID=2876714 RepID=UPI001CCBDF47|nr:FCD domain-containing protein [Celeribacter litoreus]MCA0043949.1 FCD domain-containing protein [Celeribacter litoreus]
MTDQTTSIRPRKSRPERVAGTIKEWIVEKGMKPGDRLPNEAQLIETFAMAKGTIREAMRLLQAEGLVVTRTGPGGGSFLAETSRDRANALLSNYFYFQDLSVDDIYAVRLLLEPELVAGLAGRLTEDQISSLEAVMEDYARPAENSEEERKQHVASLRFHALLAEYSANKVLGFFIGFMSQILTDLTVFRKLYSEPNLPLWERGRNHQIELIKALRSGDAERAREVMKAHMEYARHMMDAQEATVTRRFLNA